MAATIEIVEQPDEFTYYPVENCIRFVFDASGNVLQNATQPFMCITFTFEQVWPAGDYVFGGQNLTVGTGPGEVDLTTSSFIGRALNFSNWMRQNGLFTVETTIINGINGPISAIACALFKNFGRLPDSVWQFDLPQEAEFLGDRGQDLLLEDNFKYLYQLFQVDEQIECPVCPMQCATPIIGEDQNGTVRTPVVLPLSVDIHRELSSFVQTSIPSDLSGPTQIDGTISSMFFLKVGYSQQSVGECSARLEGFTDTNKFCVINQAVPVEKGPAEMVREQYFIEPGSLTPTPSKFLTSAPSNSKICLGDYDWLWYNANFIKSSGIATENVQNYWIRITYRNALGTPVGSTFDTTSISNDAVLIIPTGPQNVRNIGSSTLTNLDDVCSYDVDIFIRLNIAPFVLRMSDTYTYFIDRSCCCTHPVYFLDSPGGYTRMPFECVETIDFVDDATEICLDTQCSDYSDELVQGRANLNKKGFCLKTLALKRWPKTPENLCMFKNFKASERKFEIFEDTLGNDQIRTVITAPGTTRIWIKEGVISLTMQIMETQYRKHISER